jgi:RimJ/RimL family protein N-acetyltransferase
MLTGEKIVLRGIEKTDLPTLRKWYNDYTFRGIFTGGYNPLSETEYETKRFAETTSEKKRVLAITLKDSGKLVGTVGYTIGEFNSAEVGIILGDQEDRHKGLGTEAVELILRICFLEENFQKLLLWTGGWNTPAARHAEKLGFRLAVRIRKSFKRDGEWQDACLYDLLREEYLERFV